MVDFLPQLSFPMVNQLHSISLAINWGQAGVGTAAEASLHAGSEAAQEFTEKLDWEAVPPPWLH